MTVKNGYRESGSRFILKLFLDLLEAILANALTVEINDIVRIVAEGAGGLIFHQNYLSLINVYLDGKQIYASVKKTEAERGVQLMGNQLGYAY